MEKFWALIVAEVFTKREAWTPHWSHQRVMLTQTWDGRNKGKPLCRASVHDEGRSVGFHQCTKAGKTQLADGSWWCTTHEPRALKARKDIQDEKYRAYTAKWDRANQIANATRAAWEALREIEAGHNDPRALAREVLAMLPDKPE